MRSFGAITTINNEQQPQQQAASAERETTANTQSAREYQHKQQYVLSNVLCASYTFLLLSYMH